MRVTRHPQDPLEFQADLVSSLQSQIDSLVLQHKMEQGLLIEMLGDAKTATAGAWKVTVVRVQRMKINEAGLKKALGARVFNKFCNMQLDRSKLEEAINAGAVDPTVVSQHTEFVNNKPFVRITKAGKADVEPAEGADE